jgi:DNA mismatch repair protein MutL
MTNQIKVLSSQLINQIAAGEVVERPASVVKELVENSLDSKAGRILCQVKEGGRQLIRVVDDGIGMSPDDLSMSVIRHATSKIASLDELMRIKTLGFRGEALPSIAAISRLRIVSRRSKDHAGSLLETEGGSQAKTSVLGAPVGTEVEVRDLFYNTPARRKFIRTPITEMGHITSWMIHLGLVRPDVHLRLEHNGKKVLEAPGSHDLAQRVASLLGRSSYEHLHPIQFDETGISIHGLVSDPGHSRNDTRGIHVFVNGRFVRDRLLQYAIMEGYRTVLPDRRFPLVVILIEMANGLVDVNVHPQKIEVRFSDARRVQRALAGCIANVLSKSPWLGLQPDHDPQIEDQPVRHYSLGSTPQATQQKERIREAMRRFGGGQAQMTYSPSLMDARSFAFSKPVAELAGKSKLSRPLSEFHFVGLLWNTYIALVDESRFVVVDQHAAHERVTFEKLKTLIDQGGVLSQMLLVPVQVDVEPNLAAVVEIESAYLQELGFDMVPFGPGVISVKAVPALLVDARVVELVQDVLGELSEMGMAGAWQDYRTKLLSTMACHSSIRAGKKLPEQEVRALLGELEHIGFAGQCPHGRPVLVEFDRSTVEHWFQRK